LGGIFKVELASVEGGLEQEIGGGEQERESAYLAIFIS
jgi:hypothetical protein